MTSDNMETEKNENIAHYSHEMLMDAEYYATPQTFTSVRNCRSGIGYS